MSLQIHTLGALDLLDDTAYSTIEEASGWSPKNTDEYVPLRASDGAVPSYRRQKEIGRDLGLIIIGATWDEVQANLTALESTLSQAFQLATSATPITYVEWDTTAAAPDTWKCIGGRFIPSDKLRLTSEWQGILQLALSKA